MKTKVELIKNYPIESLKNWGDYFGYPEGICKELAGMVDCDWENVKIAVLDDFGFQMINFLIKVKNVPLQNIYFLVSEEDETKVKSMKKWYSNFVENEILSVYNINMSFDLILANPPYGKSSSLSKKIVNTLLENKVAKEMIVLAPPKTFYGILDYSKELKCVSSYLTKTFVFEDVHVETLFLDHIVTEKQNKYTQPSDFLLGEKHKVFRNAVIEYNKTHSNNVRLFGGNGVQKYEKSKYSNFEDSLLFEIPIYTPSPVNGVARQGESYEHNVLRKPIDWDSREKGRGPGLLYFANSFEYNNFSNWWYSAKKRREGGLINFMFDILFVLYGGGPSLLKYVEVIPHLDWSRSWIDQEILKEIGLPEDFLEKE